MVRDRAQHSPTLSLRTMLEYYIYNGHKRNLKKLQIFLETSKKLIVML